MAAGPHSAFFYGTLMHPKVLSRVCHGPSLPNSTTRSNQFIIRPALLKQHRRHRVLQADYPAVTPNDESTVRGTLVSGLTDGDIWRLDIFEGDEYERRTVNVRVIKDEGDINMEPTEEQLGAEVRAETYIYTAVMEHLEDKEWDYQEFVRDKMARWVGSGAEEAGEYNEVDEAVKTQNSDGKDPSGGRSMDGYRSQAVEQSRQQEPLKSAV